MCFHDESWPVRDEACLACGTFCLAYADECLSELPTLFERWTEQLSDQVRDDFISPCTYIYIYMLTPFNNRYGVYVRMLLLPLEMPLQPTDLQC